MAIARHQQRRLFIAGLAATLTWPVIARAQQSAKLPRVGFIGSSTASAMTTWIAAFTRRLGELGWIENQTLTIDYQFAEGRDDRYSEIATDFVRQKVDVIVTYGTPPTKAAKAATATIPVVFAAAADPVAAGLVQSLRRPGANVTGLSLQQSDIVGKKIELLRETLGSLSKLAIAGNVANPVSVLEIKEVTALAKKLSIDVVVLEFRRAEDIEPAFETLHGQASALYVSTDPFVLSNVSHINALATSARLPTIYNSREYLETGGLLSYGPNYPDLFRQAAELVSKILRGTKPADLPVGQPTKFDFIINNRTAEALGIVLSPSMLARADEVIE
jgi:putative ABC transport system substrate-binding protein